RRSGEAVHAAEHVDDVGVGGFVRGEWRATLLESGQPAPARSDESPLGRGRADVRALADGDPDLDELGLARARSALRAGYRLWAPWIAMEAVRHGVAPRSCRFVEEVAGSTDGPLPAAFVDHALGSLEGDIARIDAAAKVLDGLGAHGLALDAAVTALDHMASRVDLDADDELVPLRRRIVVLDRHCALPPRTADRVAAIAERVGMPTDRQLEIAALVADGRTSKEVAAQLVVSARTVDNHLAAVYRKFAVSGRAELAELF
ncbi:MAG: LuxR C-terminal-related transcriptional regulator, partial [Ilumatobacter sp.]